MLGGVFHLHEQEAREVMTPIPAVVTVNASETVEDALQRCVSSGHTRLVVIEDDNPDRVRGIVHNNSLARLYMNAGPDASIEPAIRDVPIFPETKPLDDLLAELQRQRSSIAVVSTSTAAPSGSSPSRTSSRRSWARSRTRPTRAATRCGELTDGDWYVRGHVSLGDLEDAGIELPGRLRRLQLDRRLRLLASSAGCRSAATRSSPTATRSGSSRSARTASSRCGSTPTARRPQEHRGARARSDDCAD